MPETPVVAGQILIYWLFLVAFASSQGMVEDKC
jgi:hypothetical protein